MTSLEWNYTGIYPNGAEASGCFWGFKGIRSFAGNPYPLGVLSAESTEVTTPNDNVITCTAINTIAFAWQVSTNGTTWADIADEYGSTLTIHYLLGDHGTYQYRCICYGILGTSTTDPIEITVTEPAISVYLTSDKSSIVIGETALISAFITPYPEYAKSFKWQQSSDAETWTDIPGVTSQSYTFAGTEAGARYFRMEAQQYDDITVRSQELEIEITEE